jgi:hypothetical protein
MVGNSPEVGRTAAIPQENRHSNAARPEITPCQKRTPVYLENLEVDRDLRARSDDAGCLRRLYGHRSFGRGKKTKTP